MAHCCFDLKERQSIPLLTYLYDQHFYNVFCLIINFVINLYFIFKTFNNFLVTYKVTILIICKVKLYWLFTNLTLLSIILLKIYLTATLIFLKKGKQAYWCTIHHFKAIILAAHSTFFSSWFHKVVEVMLPHGDCKLTHTCWSTPPTLPKLSLTTKPANPI